MMMMVMMMMIMMVMWMISYSILGNTWYTYVCMWKKDQLPNSHLLLGKP